MSPSNQPIRGHAGAAGGAAHGVMVVIVVLVSCGEDCRTSSRTRIDVAEDSGQLHLELRERRRGVEKCGARADWAQRKRYSRCMVGTRRV